MTRTDDGSLSAATIGSTTPQSTAPMTAAQPLSRREAREQERQAERKTPAPSIPAPSEAAATIAPAEAAARVRAIARGVGGGAGSVRPKGRARAERSKGHGPLRTLMSMGAMVGVAAMLISTSISGTNFAPAEASDLTAAQVASDDVQSLGVVAAAGTTAGDLVRDSFSAKAYVPPVKSVKTVRFAQQSGAPSGGWTYTNNPSGSIQWPFVNPAPISYGFGPRNACSYCSSYHLGVDFTPGSGVPIQSIADGVVSSVRLDGGGLGNHVVVDHVVNGQRISSVYAHMQWGSIQVAAGQQVSVGTVLGAVGSTGASTGAHLHLEIHADGTPIDPFAWLKANAN